MELYYISLHSVDRTMRRQFGEPDEHERRKRRDTVPSRPSRTTRMRLALSAGLYRLASALDPAAAGDVGTARHHA
jgi:hypothetical protein